MSDKQNQLLIAAMLRAGKPVASDDLLDAATGLALDEGWDRMHMQWLTRRSVARRLQLFEEQGIVRQRGSAIDSASRRPTPLYEPVVGFDSAAVVPAPPEFSRKDVKAEASYDNLSRSQLLAVLDVHDGIAGCLQRFMTDLGRERERARARLLAAGLGE